MSLLISRLNTPRRIHAAAYLFFFAIAVLMTWPLVTVLSTHFAGYDFGDAHEMTRHIWWFKYAAQHGAPLLFQPLLGYPDGMEGVILWSDPLQFFPGWLFAFFMPLPAAYNLQSLLNLALNGWAAYFLVWKLTGQRLPALLAGVVFMAAPTIQGHLAGGHGGLLVQWPLPLLAYALIRLRASTRPTPAANDHTPVGEGLRPSRLSPTTPLNPASPLSTQHAARSTSSPSSLSTQYSALSTIFFLLLPFGHTLQLIYAGLPLLAVFGLTLLVERNWRGLLHLIVSIGVGAILLGLFLTPVLSATLGTSAYTGEGGGVAYSIDLLSLVTPSFDHPLYGQLDYTHRVLGINIVEGSSYIGIVAGILALVAAWKLRAARWWLLLAGVAWVLALGPLLKIFDQPVSLHNAEYSSFVTLPWALVADLPGFSLARTPGRFNFLIALAISVLSGYGLSTLLRPSTHLSPASESISPSLSTQHSAPSTSSPSSLSTQYAARSTSSPPSLSTQHAARSTSSPPSLSTQHAARSTSSPSSLSTQHSALSTLFLIALVLLDYQSFWPLPTYSAEVPQAVHDLAAREDVRAVFDMPWDNLLAAKDALWLQTAHEKPLIAGQVTRRTPVNPAKLTILERTLDPVLLDEAGADVIILHKTYDYDGTLGTFARERLGAPFYEDERLVIWDVPEGDSVSPLWITPAPWLSAYPLEDVVTDIPLSGNQMSGSNEITSYIYAPESGWLSYRVNLYLPPPATALLYLDDRPLQQITSTDNLWIPISEPGYHSLRLATQTTCPQLNAPSFYCGFLWPSEFTIGDFVPDSLDQWIAFSRGVTLKGSSFGTRYGIRSSVTLWWQFDEPVTDQDVRFVKVLDESGDQVAGFDTTLGAFAAGEGHLETLVLGLPSDLLPGTYRVYVGWYSYPNLTRFPVLSDVPGAADGWAMIAEFTVPAD